VVSGDAHVVAHERLGSRRTKEHEHLGAHQSKLGLEPWQTGSGLDPVRALVQTPLATGRRAPFEVLDDVRDEDRLAIDPGRLERLVEDPPGRADERRAFDVLVVARVVGRWPCLTIGSSRRHRPSNTITREGPASHVAFQSAAGPAACDRSASRVARAAPVCRNETELSLEGAPQLTRSLRERVPLHDSRIAGWP
jgi:hypothetical protein